jgi:hypothetical protein
MRSEGDGIDVLLVGELDQYRLGREADRREQSKADAEPEWAFR